MSKRSNRYVRWFGTRVPLISRGGLALFTLLVALPLSGVLSIYLGDLIFSTYWWVPFFLMLLVGTLSYSLFLLILDSRYKNPPTNAAFLDLIDRILQKILVPSSAQVWIRRSNEAFIASTYNPVFNAVIVSEPMVDLILKSPEAGEVLLAFHLARMPRKPWFGDCLGSLVLLVTLTYPSAIFLVPIITDVISSIMAGYGYMIISLASMFAYIFFLPIILAIIIRGAFWKHEPAFIRVLEVYGMHPQVAKVEVERGTPLNEEEIQSVVWGVREWEKRKRSSRRLGVSVIAAIPTGVIVLYLELSFATFPYYFWLGLLPFIIPFLVGVIIYFFLRRWDNNAMGEVFIETTDSHEPIWMD